MKDEDFDLEKAISEYQKDLEEAEVAARMAEEEEEYDLEAAIKNAQEMGDEYDKLVIQWDVEKDAYKPAISGIDFLTKPKRPIVAYVPGLIYAGSIQAIVGPPKAGKSTFIWSMLAELMEQRSFLGESTKLPGSVLYVSEQSEFSFDAQLERLPGELRQRILGNRKFFLMLPEHHFNLVLNKIESAVTDWDGRLRMWKEAIKKTKADVLVIDTFNQYADLGPQGENDNSMMSKRIMSLRTLQKEHPRLAILLVCHTTKASGGGKNKKRFLELADIRGGSALAGGLDHAVTFNKTSRGRSRFINVESRMIEEKRNIVVWLDNGTYMTVGDYSIRELMEEFNISFRQARKIKHELDPDNYADDQDMEETVTKLDIEYADKPKVELYGRKKYKAYKKRIEENKSAISASESTVGGSGENDS